MTTEALVTQFPALINDCVDCGLCHIVYLDYYFAYD